MLVVLLYFSFLGQCNTHTKWKSASVTHLTTTNSILSLLQPIYVHVSIRLNADIILIGWSITKYIWTSKKLVRSNALFLTELCFLIYVQKVLVESKNVWIRQRSVESFCINLDLPCLHSFLVTYAADVIL